MNEKIGRNDPCPCGSGKKYKKCHGKSNVVEISPDRYNMELNRLHDRLISFAVEHHENHLNEIVSSYPRPELIDDPDRRESYMAGVTLWTITHEPVNDKDETIFDLFYKKEEKNIRHTRVKSLFATWKEYPPAVYEVLSTGSGPGEKAAFQEIFTKETYAVPFSEEDDFKAGSIAIGILLPFIEHHEFLLSMIELRDVNEQVRDIASNYGEEGLAESFPDFLEEVLTIEEEETLHLEWDHPLYERVAEMMAKHMQAKRADEHMIAKAVLTWKAYCDTQHPSFRKPHAFAAALEYLVREAMQVEPVTQKELAEEYDTSAGMVSQKIRLLEEGFETDDMSNRLAELFEGGGFDPVDDPQLTEGRMEMEKMMRNLSKAIEERGLESEEEIQQFMKDNINNKDLGQFASSSPRDQAQDKLYEARSVETSPAKRKKLINEALELYPNSPEAYALMAEDERKPLKQLDLYRKALAAGEKDLGEEFFRENKGHFWMMMETRPYMRTKAEYGVTLYAMGDKDQAIRHFEELIELNPHDNQGIRYLLVTAYLDEKRYQDAEQVLQRYAEDSSAAFQFNRALLAYFTDGLNSETKALLKQADEQNPHVKGYLTGKKQVPEEQSNYIGVGDDTEAVDYVQQNIQLWEDAREMMKALERM
ncbi:tetratricopeptide repeat protein [Lentibacillus sediminis]|uniref:tetratricopeptide repeat protein n=1 Tax=Lentibacillus sediminis TaxID=1940529 RepID=UPI00117B8042|nr:tetratricopeptide repeat protein [Lentibacillus sediminis]